MPIAAGKLDRRIFIDALSKARDARGGVVESWTELSPVTGIWAELEPIDSAEKFASDKLRTVETYDATIRWRAGITTEHRVRYAAKEFDILTITEVGRREGLKLRLVHGLRS